MGKVNLFFAGEPKSGTTTMYEYLKNHPEVSVPHVKEPHHFATDILRSSDSYHGYKKYFLYRTKNEYEKLWNETNKNNVKYRADFSTNYLYSSEAAKNIYEYNSDAKIVIIFREPVSFLQSLHKQFLKTGDEKEKDFMEALEKEKERKKNRKQIYLNMIAPEYLYYREWVKYSEQLQRYLDLFPHSNIKVIFYEDFKKDNENVMEKIYEFLGIKNITLNEENVNVRRDVRFLGLRNLMIWLYQNKTFRNLVPSYILKKLQFLGNKITLKKSQSKSLKTKDKEKLKNNFSVEVEKLEELLKREGFLQPEFDLKEYWGYK